ncbi:TonB-dependent receptor [Microbulbifer bruguierae]|uniref:TonB-dependent receptor n=1 Tax=Microbulbifer bruguierae TaxID=3029061 RepID=A0ABY8NE95_9GAMM|nr:TonB-dependent receptor [Microbulbifer bruguierae]WGL15783.1 TonB-dependent receptor [Microbulbifer bruguierae]
MKRHSKKILPLAIALVSTSAFAQEEKKESENERFDATYEEIYVEGVRSADLNARAAERNKDNFSSVVTQDDAGNFSDQNAAELLRRMPGVTLQKSEGEGKFVSLRGLGPGMVSVRMDGGVMANAGGGSNGDLEDRAFSLDGLPTDVLQAIEVNKSLTPDMDLDAIGGSINVKTLSALDRGRDTFKFRAQNYYQDQAAENSPKVSIQGTNLFLDEKLGIAYTGSWESRTTQGYETRHHADTLPTYVNTAGGDRMLVPWEFETRQENAERERLAGLLNLEYQPDDNSRYFVRLNHNSYEDVDVALREYYRFNVEGEVPYIDLENNVFGVGSVDLQQQFFIQESKVTTNTISLGGENRFGDGWEAEYELTSSRSENEKPDGRRVQFRVRDLAAISRSGDGYLNGQIVDPDWLAELSGQSIAGAGGHSGAGYVMGEVSQPNMKYDNLFMEDSLRNDEVNQFSLDLRKDFNNGLINYVKAGGKIRQRTRDFDKNRASIVPEDKAGLGCAGDLTCVDLAGSTLGDFETYIPENGNFDHAMITQAEAERLIDATRAIGDNYDPDQTEVESTRLDYALSEDIFALYIMAEFQVLPEATLIAGGRYEHTDFTSTGYFSIRNDRNEVGESQLTSFDIGLPLENVGNKYGNYLPALHYRHELSENLLGRASLWTSFSRPDFGKSRAFFEVTDRVVFCNTDQASEFFGECNEDPADIGSIRGDLEYQSENFAMSGDNSVRIGNPALDPMRSTNLDLSLSYYGESTFLEGALFYKGIQDFIVDAAGVNVNIANLGFVLPVRQVDLFYIDPNLTITNANTYLNGEDASVYGAELSFSHYLDGRWEDHAVGRWLDNMFVQANLTVQHSEGKVGDTVRVGTIQLPEQADIASNLTVGWENEDFSLRFIANYTSEILKRIGSCTAEDMQADAALGYAENCATWGDVYQDASVSFDVKANYRVMDGVNLYLDAINITDSVDQYYFAGNADSGGRMLFDVEQYGPGYQLGLTVDF